MSCPLSIFFHRSSHTDLVISYSFCEKSDASRLNASRPASRRSYLEWRAKNFWVKKESTMKSYWKRLSCGYIDATGCRMDNGTELDVRDVR